MLGFILLYDDASRIMEWKVLRDILVHQKKNGERYSPIWIQKIIQL